MPFSITSGAHERWMHHSTRPHLSFCPLCNDLSSRNGWYSFKPDLTARTWVKLMNVLWTILRLQSREKSSSSIKLCLNPHFNICDYAKKLLCKQDGNNLHKGKLLILRSLKRKIRIQSIVIEECMHLSTRASVPTHACAEARTGQRVPSSSIPYILPWDRVSHWTENCLSVLDSQSSEC